MIPLRKQSLPLFWKILLATSGAMTVLFGLAGWVARDYAAHVASQTLEEEVQASFRAYESLWQARAREVASVSQILSAMSDVRAAFSTGDQATIRDTAGELWARVSDENAIFLVTDPQGRLIASLSGADFPGELEVVREAAASFPKQASGFLVRDKGLYQVTVTPVYVQGARGNNLINVLVAGFFVDTLVAQRLRQATGGSEFLFLSGERVIASTLNPRASGELARQLHQGAPGPRVNDGVIEYAPLVQPLRDIQGRKVAELCILRSFESANQRIAALRRNMVLAWMLAITMGGMLTFWLARRIVQPVEQLDRAAAEIARQNYDYRVQVGGNDELGRLARTFNGMADSLRQARQELIRHERISTIGRLSSSIVHDMRNPLAAIYGGAEMLVDAALSPEQVKRLAGNIYRASRKIQQMLQDLLDVSRGKSQAAETCRLQELAAAACDAYSTVAERQRVTFVNEIPADIELPLERARIERVFLNLIGNALEVMPAGGRVSLSARTDDHDVLVSVEDTGPGIAAEIRSALFQPFVTAGKKSGLGLGLALSRQTVLDHGGDMWVDAESGRGARFLFRLPLARSAVAR